MIRPDQRAETGGVNVGEGVGGNVIIGYTIEQHEAALARQEKRVRKDLKRAHTAEKALLQRRLDEIHRRMADLEGSYEARRNELAEAKAALRELGGLPQAKLDAALPALNEGDSGKADERRKELAEARAALRELGGQPQAKLDAALAALNEGESGGADERRNELAEAEAALRELGGLPRTKLDEIHRRMADVEGSYEARRKELAEAQAALRELGGLPQAKLDAALAALDKGETGKADELFAQVQAMEAASVARAAAAAFERGKLASGEVRWADAAGHYGTAARLAPSYEHLLAAREMAWRSADYPAALRLGDDLIDAAVSEHGAGGAEHAEGLNDHPITLARAGRYAEAEPLYRQALAIDEKTIGTGHHDHATHLHNLALLLRDMGRRAEAEPLYRQALAIDEKTIRTGHPDHANLLDNLALLLKDMGRPAEAEPLHRQALAIDEKTLGTGHPDHATHLNNLALLLQDLGRPAEAEPLYRQALAIVEAALGPEHPTTVITAKNLAVLEAEQGTGAVQVIAGLAVIIVAWATGLLRWIFGLFRREKPEPTKDARPTQTASSGGVNVGGKVEGNVTTGRERKR